MGKKIHIQAGGPYLVDADIPLAQAKIVIDEEGTSVKWAKGGKYPAQDEPYALCRCGRSADKPYCDGTHKKIGFAGKETAPRGRDENSTKVYEGAQIDLMDEESLCASMRFCDRGARAWRAAIQSDVPGNKELAVEECACCASGRLTPYDKSGNPIEPKLPQEISPTEDTASGFRGPLWVKGGIEVVGADGESYMVRNRMTLCRCGESDNLPFCDTSHLNCPHMRGFDGK